MIDKTISPTNKTPQFGGDVRHWIQITSSADKHPGPQQSQQLQNCSYLVIQSFTSVEKTKLRHILYHFVYLCLTNWKSTFTKKRTATKQAKRQPIWLLSMLTPYFQVYLRNRGRRWTLDILDFSNSGPKRSLQFFLLFNMKQFGSQGFHLWRP